MITRAKGNLSGNRLFNIVILGCVAGALLLRLLLIPFTNFDTEGYSNWYDFIVRNGIWNSLGQDFAIYTPPYLYLLSLATLFKDVIPKIVAIKLIPIVFDLLNAVIIFKIMRLKYTHGNVPYLAAVLFLYVPTIFMNSALWGQVDSLYTCFLLVTLYMLMINRPMGAMAAFGLGLAIKAQAAFLAPFLLLIAVRRRIPWYAFGMIPLAYVTAMLPAMIAGRSLWDVSTVYLKQAAELQIPSHNAPNWYIFVPQSTYSYSAPLGLLLAGLVIAIWIYVLAKRDIDRRNETLWFTALLSLVLMPFLLPKMHDRYFYPADVFSIALAFWMPQFWFIPVCYQLISGLVYSIFLFEAERSSMLILATELNTIVIAYLVWKQFQLLRPLKKEEH